MKPVKLKKIAECFETLMDEMCYFLNVETGEIVIFESRFMEIVESVGPDSDDSKYRDWEQNTIKQVEEIFKHPDNYEELPSKYYFHEYKIIEDFCYQIEDEELRNLFLRTIKGRGAFRRFKDLAFEKGVIQNWYDYKTGVYYQYAKEWCEENKIEYIED